MTASVRCQRFPFERVRGDHKYAARFRVGHVDHSKIASVAGLPDGDARAFSAWSVFTRSVENVDDLIL
jgi:hypothetical protein